MEHTRDLRKRTGLSPLREREWKVELEQRAALVARTIPQAEQRLIEQLAHEVKRRVCAEIDYRTERLRARYWRAFAVVAVFAWVLRESYWS